MGEVLRAMLRTGCSPRYQVCIALPSLVAGLLALACWPVWMPAWLACYIAMFALADWAWRMHAAWRALRRRGAMVARHWADSPARDYEDRFAIITTGGPFLPRRLWIMVHSLDGQVRTCQGFTLTRRRELTPQALLRKRTSLLERLAHDGLAFPYYAHPHAAAGSGQ